MAIGIFISAGRINYWQGWAYLILFGALAFFSLIMVPSDLAFERMKPGGNFEKWDKYFLAFYNPMTILIPAISAVDANRLHIFFPIPEYFNIIGFVIIFLCSLFIIWCIRVNIFFSSVVRIQKDRGQKVIQNGPYKIVRHPGYLGTIILYLFLPISMNSIFGLLGSLILISAFFIRTYLEDKFLQDKLEGYNEYSRVVKFRLIPKIW
jgi:protein-S-isoprenylcysteine O-methyltransferase Ste14